MPCSESNHEHLMRCSLHASLRRETPRLSITISNLGHNAMSEFVLTFMQSKVDSEASELLDRIHRGSGADVNQALSELVSRAERSSDPDDWNAVGIGFHYAGLSDQSTRVFGAIVQHHPERDVYRLNLAISYAQTVQIELCRYHLRQLAEHGSTEEWRRIGREQLDGYERFLGLTEADQKLRELQIRSLRMAIDSPERTSGDFVMLAKLLLSRSKLEPGGDWLSQSASVLEQGREIFPRQSEILELLITTYLREDPEDRLPETVTQLEKLDPNSDALKLLATLGDEEAATFSQNIYQRADELMRLTIDNRDNNDIREAALHDLERIVTMYPQNSDYRLIYAFTLMGLKRCEAALEEARKLAVVPNNSHSFHFNLGQIFWICGAPTQGRHHLDIALRHAKDEQERQDVRNRIAELER
jgi:hypothetical protein